MRYNAKGEEVHDAPPMEAPAGFKEPESLNSMIRRLINTAVSDAARNVGAETIEEANDFEVDDDELPETKYEVLGDEQLQQESERIADARAAAKIIAARRARRNAASSRNAPGSKPNVNSDAPPRSDRGDSGQRRSAGDGSVAPSPRAESGSE